MKIFSDAHIGNTWWLMELSNLSSALASLEPSLCWAVGKDKYHWKQPGMRAGSGLRWLTHTGQAYGKQIYSWDLSLAKDVLQDWVFDRPLVPRPICRGDLPRCSDSGKVHGSWRRSRAASPGTGPGDGSFPSSADKLHSCGVTCQHLHCGSPETNQECSACQTVALSHYIETTFLREPWAPGEREERGILSRSDPQPCNERQTTAMRPDL